MEALRESAGIVDELLERDEAIEPEAEYYIGIYFSLWGEGKLSLSEVEAFAGFYGLSFEPWEIDLLRSIDDRIQRELNAKLRGNRGRRNTGN